MRKRARTSCACSTRTATINRRDTGVTSGPRFSHDHAHSTPAAPPRRLRVLRLPILDSYLLQRDDRPVLLCVWARSCYSGRSTFSFLPPITSSISTRRSSWCCVSWCSASRRRPQWRFRSRALFAALLAMGRVMGDNEVTAMRTAGIPVMRIALTPVLFGVANVPDLLLHKRMGCSGIRRSLDAHVLSDHLSHRLASRRAAVFP